MTDRELLNDILRRLRRIEEHLGLEEFKSDIVRSGASGVRTKRNTGPVEPAVDPKKSKRLPSKGPRPELIDPKQRSSGGPLKDY
jgi:hypothetical protein